MADDGLPHIRNMSLTPRNKIPKQTEAQATAAARDTTTEGRRRGLPEALTSAGVKPRRPKWRFFNVGGAGRAKARFTRVVAFVPKPKLDRERPVSRFL